MDNNQRQTILIADDSKANILILADLLKKECAIKIATNGQDALRIAFSAEPPDLILLDIMMPKMDGYEVCEKLKEAPETKDIPVIFLTAMDQIKDEEYGLRLGAIDYIVKPISPAILKMRVKNHLELKQYRDRLKQSAMIDGLTSVPNRRRFDEALKIEWQRAQRYNQPLSLVMVDIDYFKNYNDTYGHLEGDECLRQVAAALQNTLKRPTDMAARWGGEEFACLLPDTDKEDATMLAETLRQAVEEIKMPHKSSLVAEVVTISVGIATKHPSIEQLPDVIVDQADRALYRAKESGRNRVCTDAKSNHRQNPK